MLQDKACMDVGLVAVSSILPAHPVFFTTTLKTPEQQVSYQKLMGWVKLLLGLMISTPLTLTGINPSPKHPVLTRTNNDNEIAVTENVSWKHLF